MVFDWTRHRVDVAEREADCLLAGIRAVANQRPQAPLHRDPLELLQASIAELETRSGDQIMERTGHKDLAWPCVGHHSVGDVHGNPAELLVGGLCLSNMRARPDRDGP